MFSFGLGISGGTVTVTGDCVGNDWVPGAINASVDSESETIINTSGTSTLFLENGAQSTQIRNTSATHDVSGVNTLTFKNGAFSR